MFPSYTLIRWKNRSQLVGASFFTAIYLFVCLWLRFTNVMDNNFFSGGLIYVPYHLLKTIFVLFFIWFLYYLGKLAIAATTKNGFSFELNTLDRFILCFHVGGSIVCLIMLALGYLNLYFTWIALFLTAPIIFTSFPDFSSAVGKVLHGRRRFLLSRYPVHAVILTAIVLLVMYVFISKALYPTADPDTLTHYDLYYQQVIQNHGIYPNVEWYQYYYGKASGNMFLGILLTDDQGHKLVTFCFVLVNALIMFSLVKKMSKSSPWALAATLVYLTTLIGEQQSYTRTVFGKQHILMSTLFFASIWTVVQTNLIPKKSLSRWFFFSGLLVIHCILFVPTTFIFLFPTFVVLALFYYVKGSRTLAKGLASLATITLLVYFANMGVNYVTSGVPEGNPWRIMWNISDQKRFSEWMSPYVQIYLNEGSDPTMGTLSITKNYAWQEWFYRLLNLDWIDWILPAVYPLVFLSLIIISAFLRGERLNKPVLVIVFPIILLLLASAGGSIFFNQALSMFRYYVFLTPFLIVLVIAFWQLLLDLCCKESIQKLALSLCALGLALGSLYHLSGNRGRDLSLAEQFRFLVGQDSFADTYRLLSHYNWDLVIYWPELAEAKTLIGIDKRVLVFHQNWGIGAVPGRKPETDVHSGYKEWHTMAFNAPEEAEAAFKREGLEYFALTVDNHLQDMKIYGALVYSPIFAPENIRKYLDVVYAKNGTYLLTWKGNTTDPQPWDFDFEAKWTASLNQQPALLRLYERVKMYYEKNNKAVYPVVTDPNLPAVGGLQ